MMRFETRVKILSATLAFLLLALAAGWVFDPARRLERAESTRLVSAKKEAIARVELGGALPLVLEREGGSWFLLRGAERLPAEAGKVGAFLDALDRVTRLAAVAGSSSAWEGYGLAEGKARRVVLKDAAKSAIADFWVGDYGNTGREVYLRLAGKDASYSVDSGFVSYLGYGPSGWLDLRVLPDSGGAEKVQSVAAQGKLLLDAGAAKARTFGWKIVRSQGGWNQSPEGTAIDAVAAESLVRAAVNLQAEDIAPAGTPFGATGASLSLELADGRTVSLEVGESAGDGRWKLRRSGGDGRVWTVSSYALGNLFKELSALAARK
jgi:hypothetical protein